MCKEARLTYYEDFVGLSELPQLYQFTIATVIKLKQHLQHTRAHNQPTKQSLSLVQSTQIPASVSKLLTLVQPNTSRSESSVMTKSTIPSFCR